MPATSETRTAERQILLVGPYGVLGTGVVDAVAEHPKWGITTAARRPVPTQYKRVPLFRLLRNEGGKKTRAMFRVPEHRFFVLGRQIHVIVGGSRIRWPAGLHAACVRRECSACVSDCRRLRPS